MQATPRRPRRIDREAAETIAVDVLAFLAADADRLDRFLSLTGLSPSDLRLAADSPGFLAGVLDHLMADEPLLVAFADDRAVDPTEIARAHAALAGARDGEG